MDPTITEYGTLANLGVSGVMAILFLRWYHQANDRADKDRKEREKQDGQPL